MSDEYCPFSVTNFEKGFLPEISTLISYISLSFPLKDSIRETINSANLFYFLHSYRFRKYSYSKNFQNSYFHYINSFSHNESDDLLAYLKLFLIVSFKEILGNSVSRISVDYNNKKSFVKCSGFLRFITEEKRLSVIPYAVQRTDVTPMIIDLMFQEHIEDNDSFTKSLSNYITISIVKEGSK